MISYKLWRALSRPPRRHPLFNYVLSGSKQERPQVTSGFVVWGMMIATFIFTSSVLLKPLTWVVLSLFIGLNSIYASRWVLRISRTLTQERESRRYDLLASLPVGLLGTSWALSTGVVHRRSSFRWMPYLILVISVVSFLAICSLSTITLTLIDQLSDSENALTQNLAFARDAIVALPFIVLFYIDHIYSILTAIVFGQLATVDVKDTADGQLRALFGFLAIQVILYSISLSVVVFLIPSLFTALGQITVVHLIGVSLVGIIVFTILRETILLCLWRSLVYWLDADQNEITLVLKPFYEAELILKQSEQARIQRLDQVG